MTNRLKACLNPLRSDLGDMVAKKIDLYGPFWITTSLIFTLIIAGHMWDILKHIFARAEFNYDYTLIGSAVSIVYTAFGLFPTVFYGINKVFGTEVSLLKSFAIYGYSFAPFLAASVLFILPISFLRVLIMLLAGGHSIVFLLSNFKK